MSTATTSTTVVRPVDPALRSALRLALIFSALKLLLHLSTNLWEAHIGYGYFRDELYYLACGRHLAWGYVDHGPIVGVQARLAETLFGHSLAGIRTLSALAGAARVFLTGLLAWSLGGSRAAQSLAMTAILLAPQYLGLDSFLSMNSFESLFWMTCLLALILVLRDHNAQWSWMLFGLAAGLGLLNKPSMTFFLIALLAALLLTQQRHILFTSHAAAGVALLLLVALPNLLWQIAHHWPTLEFLHNGRVENKNIALAPIPFLAKQILSLNPITLLLWLPGLIWLLRNPAARSLRWLGYTYLLFLATMMALHAKDYYVSPIYPILFSAGGVAWEQRLPLFRRNSIYPFPLYQTLLLITGVLILPMAVPVMPPMQWVAYAKAIHLYEQSGNSENESSGILPQFYADRFGWQEEVDQITRIVHSLSPEDQSKVAILCSNYGEASAINILGHGLPIAISGHNNYWLWGPYGATGEIIIAINGATREEMHKFYNSVEIAGRMDHPLSMPFEHRNIYLVRHRRSNLSEDWKSAKFYY